MHLKGVHFLQGNIACAEGAIAAGCRFFAGYPITPSTEIAEWLARRLPKIGGVYIQMEDEIGSIAAIIGARWAGVKSMTATSGPGFSLMQENIGYAAMTETPIVIVNVQRGGPSTGQPTLPSQQDVLQSMHGSHGDYEVIVLSPNSPQEMFDLTVLAFNYSEMYRVPVILLSDEIVGHMREKVIIPENVETYTAPLPDKDSLPFEPDPETLVPKMPIFGKGYRIHVTGLTHDERGYPRTYEPEIHYKLVKRLCDKIRKNADKIVRYEEKYVEDSDLIIISYGATSRSVIQTVYEMRDKGYKVGYFRFITLNPLPEKRLKEICEDKEVLVCEMNLGQIVKEVERIIKKDVYFFPKIGGEMHSPEEIFEFIKSRIKISASLP